LTKGGSLPRAARQKAELRIKKDLNLTFRVSGLGATRLTGPTSLFSLSAQYPSDPAIRGQDDAFHRCFSICVEPFQNLFGQRLLDLVVSWNCFYNSILRIHPD
jgi:hypothetical protein